jgi:hypothetical protein
MVRQARPAGDTVEGVTLHTRNDAREYMTALPETRAIRTQWQIAAKLLLDGAGVEVLTTAIELALMYEARPDVRHSRGQERH